MEDGYCVKWEKHHNAVFSVFDHLYKENVMVDCTLAAEDRFIKAHRIVLMACSPYFEELLSQHSDNYPIVWMNIRFCELQALVDFCYRGEVKLPQSDLPGFLNAARLLQIKGLCLAGSDVKRKRDVDSPNSKRRRQEEEDVIYEDADYDSINQDAVQNGGDDLFNHSASRVMGDSDNSDVDTDDESSSGEGEAGILLEEVTGGNNSTTQYVYRWSCNRCGEAFPTRNTYTDHRKQCNEKREDHPWACHKCLMSYKNKKDLVRHLLYCGIVTERHVCERCGNTYKYERGLKRHKIYCGTDVKPMVCDKCGKTYKYKRGLRRHQKQLCGVDGMLPPVRLINQGVKQNTPAKKTVELEAPAPTPSTPVGDQVCPSCGKVYKYRKPFMAHIESCRGTPAEQSIPENQSKDEGTVVAPVEQQKEIVEQPVEQMGDVEPPVVKKDSDSGEISTMVENKVEETEDQSKLVCKTDIVKPDSMEITETPEQAVEEMES